MICEFPGLIPFLCEESHTHVVQPAVAYPKPPPLHLHAKKGVLMDEGCARRSLLYQLEMKQVRPYRTMMVNRCGDPGGGHTTNNGGTAG